MKYGYTRVYNGDLDVDLAEMINEIDEKGYFKCVESSEVPTGGL